MLLSSGLRLMLNFMMRRSQNLGHVRKLRIFLLALNLMLIWLAAPLAHGQIQGVTFTALGAFNNTNNGANPYSPPVLGADGNLYGSLPYGGTNSVGVLFKVATNASQNASLAAFYTFNTWDGAYPYASLASGSDGNLYGVAFNGGTNNQGTIFEITTDGTFTLLYSFGMVTNDLGYALDGAKPIGGLVQGRDGNFYGTTSSGGTNNLGTVFQFSTNRTLTTLYSFAGNGTNDDGASPYLTPLVEGADGVFYGTTSAGGTNNDGTVFQVSADGTLTTLFEFNYTEGRSPWAGLSLGTDGNLYGTTSEGGTNGYGTVFQITTNGVLTTLFQFGGADGLNYIYGGVVPGNDNTLFGTAYQGGAGYGAVFQLTTNGVLTPLYSFNYDGDGADTIAGVIRDASGNLYGTATYSASTSYGTVYSLSFSTLLSILSPTANELWSNGVFTVTGTASDNAPGGAITNVFYSLNGAAWTNATTPNGWINWTADVTLTPDTNTIAAYAVDASGNISPTNTVSFVYVVSAPLTVSTNGVGSLSTNYNGVLLQVGNSYAITATAGTGFVFTNWTGGTNLPLTVLTNGPTVQFVMASNLMLQANFLDLAKPTISITNVPAGLNVSNAAFTVKGRAGDNWQVANVFYSLNNGSWSNAVTGNNWSNWTAAVTLVPGTNTIAAYAVDPGGNASLTTNASLFFVVTNQLQIRAVGRGTISPNYSNAWLVVGRNYSITSAPASGFIFTNWTVSTNWIGGATVTRSNLQFMMASNLTLQATFLDTNRPTLSITNLVSGQRVSNAVFTVKGTAGDNWQVSNVLCQIDGGDWASATNINNWTNWSAGVTLVPSTNTVAAYAVDTSGNLSTTSSVNFQFVVTNQLGVRAVGLGTISPNYSNAWLEIGRNYSITSSPASGFMFTNWIISTNWIGGAVVTRTNLQFMMASNLTLQANFVETNKPALAITAPASGRHMTNALATVTGTASDVWKVNAVWYQLTNAILPGGTWSQATTTNGYTNWSTTLTLAAGTNTVKAYAVNLGGNYSATNSVSFVSSNSFKLQLAITNPVPLNTTGLVFILELSAGLNGHIQVSTDLLNWVTLTNFIGTNATINFRDAAATNYSDRFYRAVVP
jgi:uncharacterized repeat protein (TIGR03803 family)